jgi:GTP-binding protein EngB required for normal cell division
MDLKIYEQIKFDLAEVIRAGKLIVSEREKDASKRYDAEQPWRKLLARLAEDRFTVVVAGRFSRGKSSLMNAVLGLDRLPTGIVPLTSVITYVRYGTSERVLLNYEGRRMRGETTLAELPEYVTEKGNPGNIKHIHSAEIQLPAEILRRGFFFVDTPGLGSAIFENTKTTESFIPEIDVLILVTSYESPLSEDEIRFLQYASASVQAVFIVINKQDTASVEAREEVARYVDKTVHSVVRDKTSQIFSVSARDGLSAKQSTDSAKLRESGLLDFEEALVQFLGNNRAQLFLVAMCDRIAGELYSLDEKQAADLSSRLQIIKQQLDPNSSPQSQGRTEPSPWIARAQPELNNINTCEVCRAVMNRTLKFLAQYQYELSTQPSVQRKHAKNGGFCPLHTWHYEQIASPRGICTAYPALLRSAAERLMEMSRRQEEGTSTFSLPLLQFHCPACNVRWATEDETVDAILKKLKEAQDSAEQRLSPLCLPHLQLILQHSEDESVRKYFLQSEANLMERTAEDMQRYAIKHDALRRDLASREEQDAYLHALQLLVGHRNVNAVFTVREIL